MVFCNFPFLWYEGTGKTVYINNHLLSGLDKEKFSIITLGFSAQTTANQTQDIIEAKLGNCCALRPWGFQIFIEFFTNFQISVARGYTDHQSAGSVLHLWMISTWYCVLPCGSRHHFNWIWFYLLWQPAKEVYGAQPPIELLRQYLDHSGNLHVPRFTWSIRPEIAKQYH